MKKQPEITEATRQRILDAFWRLYTQYDIEKITVNQLSAEAQIHRSSFYRYFPDVYAVLELFQQQLIAAIRAEIKWIREDPSNSDPDPYAHAMADVLAKYADKLYHLFHGSRGDQFKRFFTENLGEEIKLMYGLSDSMENVDYYATVMGSILLTNLTYWYEHREQYTFQEINAKAQVIIGKGLREIQRKMRSRG